MDKDHQGSRGILKSLNSIAFFVNVMWSNFLVQLTLAQEERFEKKAELVNKKENSSSVKVCVFCGARHSYDVWLILDKKTEEENVSFC